MTVHVYFDGPLSGTPFRGVITQGAFAFCAYLGVPMQHHLAGEAEFELPCHGSVTYTGEGEHFGGAGWFWYGWDYSHPGDALMLPPEMLDLLKDLGPAYTRLLKGKPWTLAEVQLDLIDVALVVNAQLEAAEAAAKALAAKISASNRID